MLIYIIFFICNLLVIVYHLKIVCSMNIFMFCNRYRNHSAGCFVYLFCVCLLSLLLVNTQYFYDFFHFLVCVLTGESVSMGTFLCVFLSLAVFSIVLCTELREHNTYAHRIASIVLRQCFLMFTFFCLRKYVILLTRAIYIYIHTLYVWKNGTGPNRMQI